MRRWAVFILCLLSTGCALSGPDSSDYRFSLDDSALRAEYLNLIAKQLTHDSSFAVIPGESGSGKIFTRCGFDDSAGICQIDTGSNQTEILNSEIGSKYKKLGTTLRGSIAGAAEFPSELIEIKNLQASGYLFGRKVISKRNDPSSSNYSIADGVLGTDVFIPFQVHFDFNHHELKINQLSRNLSWQPFYSNEPGYAFVPARLNGQKAIGLWDTGSSLTVVDAEFVRNHPERFSYVKDIKGYDGTGKTITLSLYLAAEISVGNLTIHDVMVGTLNLKNVNANMNPPIQMLLGYNVISKANWVIDFQNKKWAIESIVEEK